MGTFDFGTYATGGESLDLSGYFSSLWGVLLDQPDGLILEYDYDNSKVKAYYSSGTPTLANESSHTHAVSVQAGAEPQSQAFTKPTIALTHNADPATNLDAAALYAYEAQGGASINQIYLESTTNGNADVLGETADGLAGVAASCRFWVEDNDTPNGVQIYVAEDASDRLEFISPTEADGYIIMPFEAAVGGIPGAAIKVTVHHAADADGGKALYFDDDGAADAQLCFIDAGASGGTIPAADVEVLLPAYSDTGVIGTDAASGAGSAHTHTATAEGGDEVGNEVSLAAVTDVAFVAIGTVPV